MNSVVGVMNPKNTISILQPYFPLVPQTTQEQAPSDVRRDKLLEAEIGELIRTARASGDNTLFVCALRYDLGYGVLQG